MNSPQAKTGVEVERLIGEALEKLPADANANWVKLDNLPYIHATDDPNAKPYSSPVVGRFDYLETADYMLACCPLNIRQLLTSLAAERAEAVRVREALGSINDLYDDECNSSQLAGRMYDAACIARAALSPSQQGNPK